MAHEWQVTLNEFWVAAKDESGGDDPVMGMIGFHSTWGEEGSTRAWRLPIEGDRWPRNIPLHSVHDIDPRVGSLRLPAASVSGFIVTAVEHDSTPLSTFGKILSEVVAELRDQLEELVARTGVILPGLLLRRDDRGDTVRLLQELLKHLSENLDDKALDPGRVDGIFGTRTEAAVKAFQRVFGLKGNGEEDGVVDQTAWGILRTESAVRRVEEAAELSWAQKALVWVKSGFHADEPAERPYMRFFTNEPFIATTVPRVGALAPHKFIFDLRHQSGSWKWEVRGDISPVEHEPEPEPEFGTLPDARCVPWGGQRISLDEAVDMAGRGQGSRLQLEVTFTSRPSGVLPLTAYSTHFGIAAGSGAGGEGSQRAIVVDLVECHNGHVYDRHWRAWWRHDAAGHTVRLVLDQDDEYAFPLTADGQVAKGQDEKRGASIELVARKPAAIK